MGMFGSWKSLRKEEKKLKKKRERNKYDYS